MHFILVPHFGLWSNRNVKRPHGSGLSPNSLQKVIKHSQGNIFPSLKKQIAKHRQITNKHTLTREANQIKYLPSS